MKNIQFCDQIRFWNVMALEDFNTIVLESETNEMNLWHIAMIKIKYVLE